MNEVHDNRWLLRHRNNVASQGGEDGIIEKIFELIPVSETPWCVEFGAWDGKHFSNTHHCVSNRNWSGVMVEGDRVRFQDLRKTYADNKKIICVNKFVDFEGKDSLDNILSETRIPKEFELLSIDVDGNDYHIWKSLKHYRPRVVVIEFNATVPGDIEYVQPADRTLVQGHSILSLTKLAKEKDYELVCINRDNAFYVNKKYYHLMGIEDNSINELKYYKEPLRVFQLYDGTLVFHGYQYLYYYGLAYDFNRLQILPKIIRDSHFPWSQKVSLYRRILFKIHKWLFKPMKQVQPPFSNGFEWIDAYPAEDQCSDHRAVSKN